MQELGPAQAPPTEEQLIELCGQAIDKVIKEEMNDDLEPDRLWILRQIYKNYLYYRNLQNFAPQLFQSIVDFTGIAGASSSPLDEVANGLYDYSQNHYKGYCRKFEAVLGTRMPNAIAEPNNANDEEAVRATLAANNAAIWVRQKCELQMKILYLTFGLFNFGTMFWRIEWVVDGEKYGYKETPRYEIRQQPLGNAAFNCPNCAASQPADPNDPQPPQACPDCQAPLSMENFSPPQMVDAPVQAGTDKTERGNLEITLHDGSEISVPLDATTIDDCDWLRWDREITKARALAKYGDRLRKTNSDGADAGTSSSQYAESVRSSMASPIGLVRSRRANRWTASDIWWTPAMFQLVDEESVRAALLENFPRGVRIQKVRGTTVGLKSQELSKAWQEVKPEPSARIMADPLGNDWLETQDILTNTLNEANETIERANVPSFADPRFIDIESYQNSRSMPGEIFPVIKPAGGQLGDVMYQPAQLTFSENIPNFRAQVEQSSKEISGLLDPIWGGGEGQEPTARQAELKTNAALRQLGVPWKYIGRGVEHVYKKACLMLAEYEDGVLEFSRKNQFGQYDTLAVITEDLRSDKYHFEADEAIPSTWGQQRDLIMWMLDKPEQLLNTWGFQDPLNIFEFKQTLGMPGERTPKLDDRNNAMDVIAQLLKAAPEPGPTGPDGQPGPAQSTVQPSWEDDSAFCASLAKAYLQANPNLKTENPSGYQNVQLWGQAHEQRASQPPPPAPPKTALTVTLKGQDMGDPAVQDALTKTGLIDQGVQIQGAQQQMLASASQLQPQPTQ